MHKYKGFIRQNIAPRGAVGIVALDTNGNEVSSIPLGRLTPPSEEPIYSFGLLSDLHIYKYTVAWNARAKFEAALTCFEAQGCAFCAHCGDITQTGFYNEGDTENLDAGQFAAYKDICDAHPKLPVYGICGNHESYVLPITRNLTELKEYTGTDLYYMIERENDLFIFLGQPYNVTPMSDDALEWLRTVLEENTDKRCFIFVHPNLSSGNPCGAYTSNPLFQNWHGLDAFSQLLRDHPRTVLFHGHTHVKFECQEQDKTSTYSNADGFHSIHVPSSSKPRDVVNGALVERYEEGYGYIVDVYADCIVLNGWDFVNNQYVPLGVYKIDT